MAPVAGRPRTSRGRGAYARAGVDLAKVRSIQSTIGSTLASTFPLRAGRFGMPAIGIGHYAGLIDIGAGKLLALHTDGVGTKVMVAQMMRKYDTVGIDCVAMTVNDLVCVGSEPVALLDYIALEREDDPLVASITVGLVEGAKQAEAPIVGGETAVLHEMIRGAGRGRNGFDLVSMGVGVVHRDGLVDGSAIKEGDAIVGVESSGLHSNGYTLARRVLLSRGPIDLQERVDELDETLGSALLRPTAIYVRPTLDVLESCEVHGIAHITGGAFSKLTRLVAGGWMTKGAARNLEFRIERLEVPPLFSLIRRRGRLTEREMYRTFNMGIGMCFVTPRSEVEGVVRAFSRRGIGARQVGRMARGRGVVVGTTRVG